MEVKNPRLMAGIKVLSPSREGCINFTKIDASPKVYI